MTITAHIAQNVKGNVLAKRAKRLFVHHQDGGAAHPLVHWTMANDAGVNFANGFLDVSGELHEHDPKYGKTFTMPFNYMCPPGPTEAFKWMAFLSELLGLRTTTARTRSGLCSRRLV
jgi:hypothetical protein